MQANTKGLSGPILILAGMLGGMAWVLLHWG